MSNLKIISYNIQKVGSNPTKLLHFINIYKNDNFDIICLSEFDCNNNSFTIIKEKLKKNNYNITNINKEDKTCIIYKESIKLESTNNIKNEIPKSSSVRNYFNDITINYFNKIITVISIYVPVYLNKNSNKKDNISKFEFLDFFHKLLETQIQRSPHNFIITGDWNTRAIESPNKSHKENTFHNNMFNLKMTDIFFLGKNKKQTNYTNTPTRSESTKNRLDRCYVTPEILKKTIIKYKVSIKSKMSTHYPIIIQLTERSNNSIQNTNNKWYTKLESHFHDFLTLKSNILQKITPEPSEIPNISPITDFETLKLRIHWNKKNIMKVIKNYPPFIEFCENPPTSNNYFARLRKRFGKNESDFILKHNTITEATQFYKNLFDSKNEHSLFNDQIFNEFTKNFNESITEDEAEKLKKTVSTDELWKSLLLIIKNGSSSPGMDRITFHHWKIIWKKVSTKICNLANYIFAGKLEANSLINKILIKLIAKKSFSEKHPSINELRPISLTNTIIRLINFCLTQRMMPIFNRIISYPQQAFLKNRSIHINIQLTRLLAKDISLNFKNDKRNILMIDLRKAFDTLSHQYIERILNHIKMPKNLTTMIMKQCSGSQGHILNQNTYYNIPITFQTGVRQGLPFSPLLFNLCLEPLLRTLTIKLQGIQLKERLNFQLSRRSTEKNMHNTVNTKVLAFADDIVIFNNNFQETKKALSIAENFSKISQLEINFNKSQILTNSANINNCKYYIKRYIKKEIPILNINTNPIYLGIPLLEINWKEKINQLKSRINRILFLDLNIYERATAFNTYIYSTIYYFDEHHCLDNETIKSFSNYCKESLLIGTKIPKKRVNWHAPIHKGGLNLINLEQQLKGRRAYYIGTIITDSNVNSEVENHPFTTVLKYQIQQSLDRILQLEYIKTVIPNLVADSYNTNEAIYIQQLIDNTPGIIYNNSIRTIHYAECLKSKILEISENHKIDILQMLEEIGEKQEFKINITMILRNEQTKTTIKALMFMNEMAKYDKSIKRVRIPKEITEVTQQSDKIYTLKYDTPINYHNIQYYLRAWYELTSFHENGNNSSNSNIIQPYTIKDYIHNINSNLINFQGDFKSSHTKENLILPRDFQQTSKKLSNLEPDTSFEYWKNKGMKEEDHNKLMVRLQKLNYRSSKDAVYILMSQNGLINKMFYHSCPLCEGRGGTYHIFFECKKAEEMTEFFSNNISLKNILKNKQTNNDLSKINKVIGFLVYAQTKYWAKRKNKEPITNQLDRELFIQYKYESQTTEV